MCVDQSIKGPFAMKKTILRFVIASCTVVMLPVASQAQVAQPQAPATQQQPANTQQQQQSTKSQRPGANQNVAGQAGQSQNPSSSQQNDQKLEQLVAAKLLIANKGVVELSKMAVENANDDKVKQFAQTLVQEHESLCRDIEKLQALKGFSKQDNDSQANQSTADRSATNQTRLNEPDQPGEPKQPGQPGQQANVQGKNAQAGKWANNNQGLVGKLEMIADKACKKHLEMAKEMLKENEGENFDMAFVGMQIASHTQAVAELNALQGVGSKEMQDVVKKAEESTSKHLKQAKDLAEELSSK